MLNKIYFFKLFSFYLFFFFTTLSFKSEHLKAEDSTESSIHATSERNLGSFIREKLRIGSFSEWMTPAVNGPSIPKPSGSALAPTLVDGRVWLDYAITPKSRLLYWQRYFIFPGSDFSLYDPRFGLRLVNAIDISGLSTTYDFYALPGISKMAQDADRVFEFGLRANTSYSISGSRWDVGFLTEINATLYGTINQKKQAWGFFAPWTSYRISSRFSTQHWFTFPIKYQQGSLSWDITGMPFVQNGIGYSINNIMWLGVLLNNYLLTAPSLQNTWASLWLNFSFI